MRATLPPPPPPPPWTSDGRRRSDAEWRTRDVLLLLLLPSDEAWRIRSAAHYPSGGGSGLVFQSLQVKNGNPGPKSYITGLFHLTKGRFRYTILVLKRNWIL